MKGVKKIRHTAASMPSEPSERLTNIFVKWPEKVDAFLAQCKEISVGDRHVATSKSLVYAAFDAPNPRLGMHLCKVACAFFGCEMKALNGKSKKKMAGKGIALVRPPMPRIRIMHS